MPTLYNRQQASEMLGVSLSSLVRIIARGELQTYKLGRLVRISEEAINHYLNKCILERNHDNGGIINANDGVR